MRNLAEVTYKGYKGSKAILALKSNVELFFNKGLTITVANVVYRMATGLRDSIIENAKKGNFTYEPLSERWEKEKNILRDLIDNDGRDYPSWIFTGELLKAIHYKVNGKEFADDKEMYNYLRKLVERGVKKLRMDVGIFQGTKILGYELRGSETTSYTVETVPDGRDAYTVALALEYGTRRIPPRPIFTDTFNSSEFKMKMNEMTKRYRNSILKAWKDTRTYIYNEGTYEAAKKEREEKNIKSGDSL